ncbi:hypothetical protein LB504_007742 [Fusarium proliferatum]|nr:hypothetical protein LB504_007742 [Fusarium proliferatum]
MTSGPLKFFDLAFLVTGYSLGFAVLDTRMLPVTARFIGRGRFPPLPSQDWKFFSSMKGRRQQRTTSKEPNASPAAGLDWTLCAHLNDAERSLEFHASVASDGSIVLDANARYERLSHTKGTSPSPQS